MTIEVKERQIGIGNVSEYEIVKKQIIDALNTINTKKEFVTVDFSDFSAVSNKPSIVLNMLRKDFNLKMKGLENGKIGISSFKVEKPKVEKPVKKSKKE